MNTRNKNYVDLFEGVDKNENWRALNQLIVEVVGEELTEGQIIRDYLSESLGVETRLSWVVETNLNAKKACSRFLSELKERCKVEGMELTAHSGVPKEVNYVMSYPKENGGAFCTLIYFSDKNPIPVCGFQFNIIGNFAEPDNME